MPKFDSRHSEDLFVKELEFWGLHDDLRKINKRHESPPRKRVAEGRKSKLQPQARQRSLKEQAEALNQESIAPKKQGAYVQKTDPWGPQSPKKVV